MPARVLVDDGVAEAARPAAVEIVRAALGPSAEADSVIAVVTRLPSGRLTVFFNHVRDPDFVASIDAQLAKLR